MNNNYHRMMRGEIDPPPVFTLLGGQIRALDLSDGRLHVDYQGQSTFRNPMGSIQGGMLCAMLDDLTAGLVDATVEKGQGVSTLSMNVLFLRPAQVGILHGCSTLIRRGRDICHVTATLSQNGKDIASATAVCKVLPTAGQS